MSPYPWLILLHHRFGWTVQNAPVTIVALFVINNREFPSLDGFSRTDHDALAADAATFFYEFHRHRPVPPFVYMREKF